MGEFFKWLFQDVYADTQDAPVATVVVEEPMYMNGEGVKAETWRLIDDLWRHVLGGIFGSSAAVAGPFIGYLLYEFDEIHWLAALGIALPSVIAGVWAALPWFRAEAKLKAHNDAVRKETEKRGKGWARS